MSTGKTTNLNLNQWTLSDRFSMEEFNEDNRKIDTAVAAAQTAAQAAQAAAQAAAQNAVSAANNAFAAVPFVKLMDITTTADVQQVVLNLQSINLAEYAKLCLCGTFKGKNGVITITVPGGSYYANSNSSSAATSSALGTCPCTNMDGFDFLLSSLHSEFVFPVSAIGGISGRYISVHTNGAGPAFMGSPVSVFDGCLYMPTGAAFSAINLTGSSADTIIFAGSRIVLYGVKL